MTKPPCKTPDGNDCPRRYIGCRAECEAWHEWLVIHEAEKEQMRRNKHSDLDVDGFLALQNKRVSDSNHRERMKEYREKHRR